MTSFSRSTAPLFADTAPAIETATWMGASERDLQAEVIVVGAGISGLTTAYLLARSGKSVLVLERDKIGGGMTGRTTAHLSCVLDDRYSKLLKTRSATDVQLVASSHRAAIDLIEEIAGREAIACDFARVDGYLFVPTGEDPALLDEEFDAALKAGLLKVRKFPTAPVDGLENGPCLGFPDQARFHGPCAGDRAKRRAHPDGRLCQRR